MNRKRTTGIAESVTPGLAHTTAGFQSCINSGIRDNNTRGTVADFLREKIKSDAQLSIVSAYFTIYAYDQLKESLDCIDPLDFFFGKPSFVNRLEGKKKS